MREIPHCWNQEICVWKYTVQEGKSLDSGVRLRDLHRWFATGRLPPSLQLHHVPSGCALPLFWAVAASYRPEPAPLAQGQDGVADMDVDQVVTYVARERQPDGRLSEAAMLDATPAWPAMPTLPVGRDMDICAAGHYTLVLVVDTNVLMTHLAQLTRLRWEVTAQHSSLPIHLTCIIPYVAFQELDLLKRGRGQTGQAGITGRMAQAALTQISEKLAQDNSCFRGQTSAEFQAARCTQLPLAGNDDYILQCAVHEQNTRQGVLQPGSACEQSNSREPAVVLAPPPQLPALASTPAPRLAHTLHAHQAVGAWRELGQEVVEHIWQLGNVLLWYRQSEAGDFWDYVFSKPETPRDVLREDFWQGMPHVFRDQLAVNKARQELYHFVQRVNGGAPPGGTAVAAAARSVQLLLTNLVAPAAYQRSRGERADMAIVKDGCSADEITTQLQDACRTASLLAAQCDQKLKME
ncbi:hypothetical protein WJX72_008622 [[Myrmecia] bisecta]|uniref:PIN domain-containing protein n=1 Tax=[Myrmecia] bisecta TaxID=41462 RepID=A0AAW1PTB1_9CHLO